MNAGEVENPSAFDSDEKTAKTTPVGGGKNPSEPSQLIDPDEPIGDDGVNYDVYADEAEINTNNTTDSTKMQFSADDIRNRKKTNYFVNIKDADKLKREAERKHAADEKRILAEQRRAARETAQAEKAAAANRTRQQKYNDSQEKNARKEIAAEKRHQHHLKKVEKRKVRLLKIKDFTWTGKRKVTTISATIATAALVLLFIFVVNPYIQAQIAEAQERARQEAIAKEDRDASSRMAELLVTIQDKVFEGYSYEECSKLYEDAIASSSNNAEKITSSIAYADYIYEETNVADKALEILETVKDLISTKTQKEKYYICAIKLYRALGQESEAASYSDLLREISPELFTGIGGEQ